MCHTARMKTSVGFLQIDSRKAFGQYLQHFERDYANDKALFEQKLRVWTDNLEQVMSNEEFQQTYLGQRRRSRELTRYGFSCSAPKQHS